MMVWLIRPWQTLLERLGLRDPWQIVPLPE